MKFFILILTILFASILHTSCQKNNTSNLHIQKQESLTKKDLISTSNLLNRDKKCFTSTVGDVSCSYTIGSDLKFTIWGIGEKNSTTVIDHTIGEDGEYQIRFTNADSCIRVKLGKKNLDKFSIIDPYYNISFISPITGRAYDNLTECTNSTNK